MMFYDNNMQCLVPCDVHVDPAFFLSQFPHRQKINLIACDEINPEQFLGGVPRRS
jgi:hypothetical protein